MQLAMMSDYASMYIYVYAYMQACKCEVACMQARVFTSVHICEFACVQFCKSAIVLECKHT